MGNGTFRVIEHTADTGLALTGESYADVLQAAADGFVHLSFGEARPEEGTPRSIEIAEDTFEDTLVELLRELLLAIETDSLRVNAVHIKGATETSCTATVFTSPLRGENEFDTHIKAVTYHDLELKQEDGVYAITVILDV